MVPLNEGHAGVGERRAPAGEDQCRVAGGGDGDASPWTGDKSDENTKGQRRSFFATSCPTTALTAASVASPMIVSLKSEAPKLIAPAPAFPPPPPAPPTSNPLRFDVPSPLALTMISPVDVSMIRAVIATLALPSDLPTAPMPNLLPNPPPPTFLLLFSVPDFVFEQTMRYLTPSA